MADLYIIAAGKGSRMGGGVPKALIPIEEGIPNITNTLKQAQGLFDSIFIVTNKDVRAAWDKYYLDNVDVFPELFNSANNSAPLVRFVSISSGLGDGHAVLSALDEVKQSYRKDTVSNKMAIVWGDAFIRHRETFQEIIDISQSRGHSDSVGFAPAVLEDNPYVSLLTDDEMKCMSADFSKYGESHPSGLHDQSVFFFDREILHKALRTLHNCFWKNGRYITPGSELSLLHAFHYLYNTNMPLTVYQTEYPTMGFNTPSEVADIQREIRKTW